jgi:hypothetical protein
MCVDKTAFLAAEWLSSPNLPQSLQNGARAFLNKGIQCEGNSFIKNRLLDGAETPEGVMKPLAEIIQKVQSSSSKEYQEFYHSSLIEKDKQRFSADFYQSLSKPYFAHPDSKWGREDIIKRQKDHFETMLNEWRMMETPEKKFNEVKLALAYRKDFGRILNDLLHGINCPEDYPYIWAPCEGLKRESEKLEQEIEGIENKPPGTEEQNLDRFVLKDPPREFVDLCEWFFSLAKRSDGKEDRPEAQWLFTAPGGDK